MTYKSHNGGYVFWNDEMIIKFKTKNGKDAYFKKVIPFEDTPNYWEYICEDGSWNVYYVKRGSNRRLAQCNVGDVGPKAILARIHDRDISVSDCKQVEEHHGRTQQEIVGVFWSKEFDGKSVFDLMEQWPKMPYAHVKMVIENEGGSIDDEGIIHRKEE